jgi:hypothetical protein
MTPVLIGDHLHCTRARFRRLKAISSIGRDRQSSICMQDNTLKMRRECKVDLGQEPFCLREGRLFKQTERTPLASQKHFESLYLCLHQRAQ